jgi:hypothetical protein
MEESMVMGPERQAILIMFQTNHFLFHSFLVLRTAAVEFYQKNKTITLHFPQCGDVCDAGAAVKVKRVHTTKGRHIFQPGAAGKV